VNTYIGGIPSSIVSADGGRERLQAYDNIYDTNSATQQQLITLQNQVLDLRRQILQLQYAKASQTVSDAPNWIANGDCSQFTLPQPVVGTCNAGANNYGFILNGRAIPIMDRWYHVMEGAGLNASNVRMEAKQVDLTSYITGSPPFGTYPSSTAKGLSLKWSNPTNSNAMISLETVNTARYGGLIGAQHIIPNIRSFVNKSYILGFWIYSSKAAKGFVRVLRQYNTTQKGGASLDTVFISSFDCVNSGWKYVTFQINFAGLSGGKTLTEDQHGCVIQIGPLFYKWSAPGGILSQTIYGHHDPFLGIITTPGLEFVLAEIQLRSDTTLLDGTGFPTNLREDERTLKYVTYASTQKPSTMNLPNNSPVILSLGQMKNVDDYYQEYFFPLSFASRLVALPNMIIWGFKNSAVGGKVGIRWNNLTQVFNSVNACPDMWGSMVASGLDINVLPYSLKKDASASNEVYYNLTKINAMRTNGFCNAREGVQIASMTESEMIFRTRLSFTDFELTSFGTNALASAVPGYVSLVTNRTEDAGWFTAIVAECDLGIYNNNGEILSYVDFNVSAPTSIPL
jgi:hypothetical protein